MPSTDLLAAFLVTTAIFAFIPGPAMLYAAARTLAGGRRAGFMASFGIHLGGYAHVAAAAAGMSVLFQAVPIAYMVVRLAGAAYLVWLGVALFRTGHQAGPPAAAPAARSGRKALIESVAVEVLNPKTALFFLAFLPQFVDPAAGMAIWLQFLALGTIVNLTFTAADLACVVLADQIMVRLGRSSRARRLMQRTGGTILVGLGTRLAFQAS